MEDYWAKDKEEERNLEIGKLDMINVILQDENKTMFRKRNDVLNQKIKVGKAWNEYKSKGIEDPIHDTLVSMENHSINLALIQYESHKIFVYEEGTIDIPSARSKCTKQESNTGDNIGYNK